MLIISFLILLGSTAESFYVLPRYKGSYHSFNGSSYKFYQTPSNWNDALSQCFNDEAELFFPKSLEELTSIQNEFQLKRNTTIFVSMISNNKTGNLLFTLDGHSYDEVYNIWTDNTVEGKNNDRECVAVEKMSELTMKNCSAKLPFICKKTFDRTTDGYQLVTERTSYKFHSNKRTWSQAFKICVEEGGRLAVIKPRFDYQIRLQEIFQEQEDFRNARKQYYVGFRQVKNGIAYYVDGTHYDKPVLPTEDDSNFLCGVQISYNTETFGFCDEQLPFICEKVY